MAENKGSTPHKVWGGILSFGLVSAPVAMFAAAREDKLSFNQLHSTCKTRLKQPAMECPACKTPAEKTDIVKGYEVSKGTFVTFTKKEIEAAEPASSRTLEITEFVPTSDVDPIYFESSFYLAVNEGGEKAYSLIREAMLLKDRVAIAKLFYSGKEHIAVVRPVPGGLMLHTLFWSYEIRNSTFTRLPEVSDKELSIACQLIDALTATFDPSRHRDQYRENMRDLIQRKQAGETLTVPPAEPGKKPPVADISAALLASIQQAKTRVAAGSIQ